MCQNKLRSNYLNINYVRNSEQKFHIEYLNGNFAKIMVSCLRCYFN